MIPKPIRFLLLLPVALGTVAPRFFIGVFLLGLLALCLWFLRLVLSVLFGD